MSFALSLYNHLPPTFRSFAASLRGLYLHRQRYDKETEKLVGQILERDFWSEKQWKQWQEDELAFILHRAATRVPFYRNLWENRRRKGDRASWEYLENWEILEKQVLRTQASEFVADDCNPAKMFREHTSGTTGTPLNLWMTKKTLKYWYSLSEARWRCWNGVSKNDRWAILGGQLITPISQKKPPFWVWNAGLKQLYMSSYHLAPDLIGEYLNALRKYRIHYLWGYTSALYSLAQKVLSENRKDIKMAVVITNAEPLFDYQKELISEAFNCPVRETYGMAEMVAAASECESNNLHQWSDAGIIEAENHFGTNQPADFICTGLVNPDMPLIRYRIGDCGIFSHKTCDCGRTLPLMGKIEGRNDDVLFTRDGRRIGRLDPIFKNNFSLIEAQLIQESLNKITVKFVPADNFSERDEKDLSNRIRERLGDVEVKLEKVLQIPRTERGKFRAVVCNLSKEEKSAISV